MNLLFRQQRRGRHDLEYSGIGDRKRQGKPSGALSSGREAQSNATGLGSRILTAVVVVGMIIVGLPSWFAGLILDFANPGLHGEQQ